MTGSLRTTAVGALVLAALSSLLPWASSADTVRIGVQTGDGRVFALVALAGLGLTLRQFGAAWMAPGFCVAIAARAAAIVTNNTTFSVGIGLWFGAAMAAVATVALIVDYLQSARDNTAG